MLVKYWGKDLCIVFSYYSRERVIFLETIVWEKAIWFLSSEQFSTKFVLKSNSGIPKVLYYPRKYFLPYLTVVREFLSSNWVKIFCLVCKVQEWASPTPEQTRILGARVWVVIRVLQVELKRAEMHTGSPAPNIFYTTHTCTTRKLNSSISSSIHL